MPEAGGDAEARGGRVLQIDSSSVCAPDNGAQPVHGTILAFDFGEQRVGVAVGETALALAHPLTTLTVTGKAARFDAIAPLIAEWKPAGLVVGLPLHMDDSEHEVTARARRFARQLQRRFNLPVELVDERMTTREAQSLLHESGVNARRQKPVRDQVAAQRILQYFFDQPTDG